MTPGANAPRADGCPRGWSAKVPRVDDRARGRSANVPRVDDSERKSSSSGRLGNPLEADLRSCESTRRGFALQGRQRESTRGRFALLRIHSKGICAPRASDNGGAAGLLETWMGLEVPHVLQGRGRAGPRRLRAAGLLGKGDRAARLPRQGDAAPLGGREFRRTRLHPMDQRGAASRMGCGPTCTAAVCMRPPELFLGASGSRANGWEGSRTASSRHRSHPCRHPCPFP